MNLPPLEPHHENPDRKCVTCAFFVHFGKGSDVGSCQRHAPRPVLDCMIRDGNYSVLWPEVLIGDFCGEWSAK